MAFQVKVGSLTNRYLAELLGTCLTIGIAHIDDMLTVNCALQVLVFEGNDIGDNGVSLISKGLYKNTNLTELWVQRCSLSTQGNVDCSYHY